MPKIVYVEQKFYGDSRKIIAAANGIIEEYSAQGFQLTLRQLYYQFVARGLIANRQKEYKRLGSIINNGRLAGLIDWRAIEDRTRNMRSLSHWENPQDMIDSALGSYRHDKWQDQEHRVEVWIEKDALVGVIEPICTELDVPYFACRGYSSQSEQWNAGQRFSRYVRDGLTPVVLHLGDHDPSGLDMTRDNEDRLNLFIGTHTDGAIVMERLALNWDQIQRYNPPPNPIKLTDSRAGNYEAAHGSESWELDALDPPVIASLIRKAVAKYRDEALWQSALKAEKKERDLLQKLKERWPAVAAMLRKRQPKGQTKRPR